jgi:hypothetical protein
MVIYSLFNIYIGYSSVHWPYVVGLVKHSCVQIRVNKASSSKNKHYHPTVVYEYEVESKKYTNNKVGNFLGFGNDEEFANQLISRYPEGGKVKVYYWPVFPKVSFLSPGMKQALASYIFLLTGVILILASFPTLFTDNPYWFIEKIFGIVNHVT